jgi:hypothetical protein
MNGKGPQLAVKSEEMRRMRRPDGKYLKQPISKDPKFSKKVNVRGKN